MVKQSNKKNLAHGKTSEVKEFDSKLLDLARVTRVTGGGKHFSFRATVVVGNRTGKVGVGVEKAKDVSFAIEKAVRRAKKNLIEVPIMKDTIPHEVEAKYIAARVLLKPSFAGKGLVAGGVMRQICNFAGIKNVTGKLLSRSKNKLNIARATIKALSALKSKAQSSNIKSSPND